MAQKPQDQTHDRETAYLARVTRRRGRAHGRGCSEPGPGNLAAFDRGLAGSLVSRFDVSRGIDPTPYLATQGHRVDSMVCLEFR